MRLRELAKRIKQLEQGGGGSGISGATAERTDIADILAAETPRVSMTPNVPTLTVIAGVTQIVAGEQILIEFGLDDPISNLVLDQARVETQTDSTVVIPYKLVGIVPPGAEWWCYRFPGSGLWGIDAVHETPLG